LCGLDFQLKFVVNIKDAYNLYIFLHNKEDIVLPTYTGLYGSTFQKIRISEYQAIESGFFQYFEIKKTGVKNLDQPHYRCDSTRAGIGAKECTDIYIEKRLGCSLPWSQWNVSALPTCQELRQYDNLFSIYQETSSMGENEIYETTGCLSSCDKNEYQMRPQSEITPKSKYLPNQFKLKMTLTSGRYIEKKKYLIYDNNTMIADIGGYLGLLLGYSILSLYNGLVDKLMIWAKTH
jgi:hypothetical protein